MNVLFSTNWSPTLIRPHAHQLNNWTNQESLSSSLVTKCVAKCVFQWAEAALMVLEGSYLGQPNATLLLTTQWQTLIRWVPWDTCHCEETIDRKVNPREYSKSAITTNNINVTKGILTHNLIKTAYTTMINCDSSTLAIGLRLSCINLFYVQVCKLMRFIIEGITMTKKWYIRNCCEAMFTRCIQHKYCFK